MASKFHNNAIITGYVDSFCLACGCFLSSERESCAHIDKPLHRKNLDLIPYLEKFKDDHIRKVQMGYYCEFCNVLFSIASKVNLHITEDSHKQNKGTLLLKHAGSDIVAFDDVIIKARSWHGVIDNMCSVCNIEFDDETLHRSNNKHLLNLVQKPVQFGANNAIYRAVEDNAIQCLTCENVIASNTMTQHFNGSEHLSLYDKCRKVKRDDATESSAAIGAQENAPSGPNDSNAKKFKDTQIKKESTIKETKSDKAVHDKILDIPEQPQMSGQLNKGSINDDESTSKERNVKDLEDFAKSNNIAFYKNRDNAYCRVCKKAMPSSLKNMKEHVALHTKNVDNVSTSKSISKQPMKEFVKSKLFVESLFFDDMAVVNDMICIPLISYLMITITDSVVRCQACEVTIPYNDRCTHHETYSHKRAMDTTPVVLSTDSEFIREVRAGVFHCGYCILVVGSWNKVQKHLHCSEHKQKKNISMLHLQRIRPLLAEYKMEQAQKAFFMRMMMGNP